MKNLEKQLRLYAVTDRTWAKTFDRLLLQTADAVDGGAGMVQLREKHLGQAEFQAEAAVFVALCRKKGALSIINDNVTVARDAGADGVHVGQEDLACARAREILGPGKIIGVSVHSVEEARRAEAAGADYLGIGAAFASSTKTEAQPVARAVFRAITEAVSIPAVAIGGITRENILQLRDLGLSGVAVISALFGRQDVRLAAAELRRLAEEIAR